MENNPILCFATKFVDTNITSILYEIDQIVLQHRHFVNDCFSRRHLEAIFVLRVFNCISSISQDFHSNLFCIYLPI